MHSPPAGASVSLSQRSRATRFGGSVTKTKKKQKRGKGTERSAAARRTLIPLRSGRQCETLSSLTQFHPPRKHARMCRFYCRLVNITRIRRRTARAPHSDERAAEQTFPAGPSLYADLFFFGSAHGSVGRTYAYIQLRRWWSHALSGTSDVDAAISSARGMHAAGLPPPSKHFAGYDLYPGSRYGHSFLASVARSNRRGEKRKKVRFAPPTWKLVNRLILFNGVATNCSSAKSFRARDALLAKRPGSPPRIPNVRPAEGADQDARNARRLAAPLFSSPSKPGKGFNVSA